MDPNEALRIIRMFAERIMNGDTDNDERRALDGESLAEHVQALDAWLAKGGFLPTVWER